MCCQRFAITDQGEGEIKRDGDGDDNRQKIQQRKAKTSMTSFYFNPTKTAT